MQLTRLEYSEYEGKEQEWTLEGLTLGKRNLLVGKNATGKTRTLNVIAGLAMFAAWLRESERRVLAFKKKAFRHKSLAARRIPAPTSARVEKLTRQLWEFGEEIRLATFAREERP